MGQQISTYISSQVAHREGVIKLKPPPMYYVVMLNDDYTPMEFVVSILVQYFGKAVLEAHEIMMQVHTQGKAICGMYSKDVAQSKVLQVIGIARQHGYGLTCVASKE